MATGTKPETRTVIEHVEYGRGDAIEKLRELKETGHTGSFTIHLSQGNVSQLEIRKKMKSEPI